MSLVVVIVLNKSIFLSEVKYLVTKKFTKYAFGVPQKNDIYYKYFYG